MTSLDTDQQKLEVIIIMKTEASENSLTDTLSTIEKLDQIDLTNDVELHSIRKNDKTTSMITSGQQPTNTATKQLGIWRILWWILITIMTICGNIAGTIDFVKIVEQSTGYLTHLFEK